MTMETVSTAFQQGLDRVIPQGVFLVRVRED